MVLHVSASFDILNEALNRTCLRWKVVALVGVKRKDAYCACMGANGCGLSGRSITNYRSTDDVGGKIPLKCSNDVHVQCVY